MNIRDEISSGEAAAAPYEMGGDTGCDFCPYRDICGFDIRIEGCGYRRVEKYSMEEAVAKMILETERHDGGAES